MDYRTQKQYKEILNTAHNGNWTSAFALTVKHGFYARDLINFYDEDYYWFDITKIALIAEGACEVRYEMELEEKAKHTDWCEKELNRLNGLLNLVVGE